MEIIKKKRGGNKTREGLGSSIDKSLPNVSSTNKNIKVTTKRTELMKSVKKETYVRTRIGLNQSKNIIPDYKDFQSVFRSVGYVGWSSAYEALEERWKLYNICEPDAASETEIEKVCKVTNENVNKDKLSFCLFLAGLADYQLNLSNSKRFQQFFIYKEMNVFMKRIQSLPAEDLFDFLVQFNFHPVQINEDDADFLSIQQYFNGPFLKIPFQEAGSRLATRELLLRQGFAFIEKLEIVEIITGAYRNSLQTKIDQFQREFSSGLPVELIPFMNYFRQIINTNQPHATVSHDMNQLIASADLLHDFYINSFPPCMSYVYSQYEKIGHLKHFSRLQLTLFLMGIGLPIEESEKFWKSKEPMSKEYVYMLRHSYGIEGGKTKYSPHSCGALNKSIRGASECNNCLLSLRMYKKDDIRTNLDRMLTLKKGNYDKNEVIEDIMIDVNNNNPTGACTKFLYLSHGLTVDENVKEVVHPCSFTARSRKFINAKNRQSMSDLIEGLGLDAVPDIKIEEDQDLMELINNMNDE